MVYPPTDGQPSKY